MILYELKSPPEHKYGGGLTEEQAERCSNMTELNSPRWAPYTARPPHVENLCGKFVVRVAGSTATEPGGAGGSGTSSASGGGGSGAKYTSCLNNQQVVVDQRLSSVCFRIDSPFGRQQELFHKDGHVTIRCTPGLPRSMIFKGTKGMQGLPNLMKDLFLDRETVVPLVHMGVVSSCMGVRLQTSQCCYLENRVLEGCGALRGGWIEVETRTPDQCNIIRLSVVDWSRFLPERLAPVGNDLVITGKGSVVHRLSWTGLPWDDDVERQLLAACGRVVEAIVSVC